jgi:hypothetical protein
MTKPKRNYRIYSASFWGPGKWQDGMRKYKTVKTTFSQVVEAYKGFLAARLSGEAAGMTVYISHGRILAVGDVKMLDLPPDVIESYEGFKKKLDKAVERGASRA